MFSPFLEIRTSWKVLNLGLLLIFAFCLALSSCSTRHTQTSALAPGEVEPTTRRVIRISADPNNLPFTNNRQEGFENKLAELVAEDLGADIQYIWRAQHRGFFRHALKEGECDLLLGVPTDIEQSLTTSSYYRSSYVFVSRQDRDLQITSFDNPKLRALKIGIQITGLDAVNPPPAYALARRGLINNVHGYTVFGDYTTENPPARIIDAVVSGEVDIAVVWGPLAGYFARQSKVPLDIRMVEPAVEPSGLPFAFDISMGVRKGDEALRNEVERILQKRRTDVQRILESYGVPVVPLEDKAAKATASP